MKKMNLKKSVISVVLSVMVMTIVSIGSVNAASTIPDLSIGGGTDTNTTTNTAAPTTNTAAPTTNTAAPATNTSTQNKTQSTSNYSNTNLPKTGVTEDYAIIGLIAICVVSAIYAYTKIRK